MMWEAISETTSSAAECERATDAFGSDPTWLIGELSSLGSSSICEYSVAYPMDVPFDAADVPIDAAVVAR